MSGGRFWLLSTAAGVLALLGAVAAVVVGAMLLQVEAGLAFLVLGRLLHRSSPARRA